MKPSGTLDRAVLWTLGAAIAAIAVTVGWLDPGVVAFRALGVTEFMEKMLPLLMVSLFIERALEVFIKSWRAGRSAQLAERAARTKHIAFPARPPHVDVVAYAQHKAGTRRIAFVAGTGIGVMLAALGIRLLELFVEPASLEALPLIQARLFRVIDVLMTGAVLGGGSDALHQLVRVFTNFFQTTAVRAKGGMDREPA